MCAAVVEGISQQKRADKSGVVPVCDVNLNRITKQDFDQMRENNRIIHEKTGVNRTTT